MNAVAVLSLSLGMFFTSAVAQASLVADTSSVFFCHKKKSTVNTIVLKNESHVTTQVTLTMTWEDGFVAKVNQCVIQYPRSCVVTLQPQREAKISVTVKPFAGGEEYGDLKISSTDPSSTDGSLTISLGASDYGGCWEAN